MSGPIETAHAHWGDTLPDFVRLLAEQCAASSQNKVAKRLNRSAALVSAVLRQSYRGDMAAVEEVILGTFANKTVICPKLGTISTATCRDWMRLGRSYSNESSERVRMYRACRSCPRMQKEEA